MSYNFTEDFTVFIPDVQENLSDFGESTFQRDHGLVVEVAAIHAGATANFNYYSEEELSKAVESWLSPHPKPIIMNHDPYSEPVGRVMGAKMATEADGTPYTRLQVAILDPKAIEKVSDGRYLTGSVGGKAKEAMCSVCGVDWANPKEGAGGGIPCKHRRGKVYNGKVAMMEMKNIEFKEYSFVNMPADAQSSVRQINRGNESEETDGWIKPARFFVLDMVEEGIVEYTESDSRDVLEGLRRKDSLPLYMGLKGAFITAQVIHEEEVSIKDSGNLDKSDTNTVDPINEENEMPKDETAANEDEDILAVAEGLSADLSAQADKEESETDEAVSEEETPEESEEEKNEEADAEEGKRPEGQEKPSGDVDPETSDGAPINRESEETDAEEADKDEDVKSPEESDETAEEASDETDSDTTAESEEGTELDSDDDKVVEPQESDLEQRVAELEDENKRLKAALKHQLVERVVDAKISLGLVEAADRSTVIEAHSDRTGASLSDTLRDLAKMEPKVVIHPVEGSPIVDATIGVVGNEKNASTIGGTEIQEAEVEPQVVFEDLMTDILMGRKKA